MLKTNAQHPKSCNPKSSRSDKWNNLLKYIWHDREEYEGNGVVVIPSDPNALLEELDRCLLVKKRVTRVLETS